MLNINFKSLSTLLTALVLILSISINARAAETVNLNQTGSISLTLQNSEGSQKPISDAEFTLYQVADVREENGGLAYHFASDFAGCGASLSDLTAAGLADHLAGYAKTQNLIGSAKTTNAKGSVAFGDLHVGLYLLVQTSDAPGYYPTAPFLVSVPMANSDGTGWIYNVDASPKAQPRPDPEEDTKLTVKKEWNGAEENRPDYIAVRLLRDGEFYDTVILNNKNGWKYTWDGLDSSYRWSVFEDEVPDGYTVSYSQAGATITITNSDNTENPGDSEELTVIKVWEDNNGKYRPIEIKVALRNKNGVYDTVVLSKANNWRHTWTDLPTDLEWEVKEIDPPAHYKVSYSRNGSVITVKNTSTDETLIQTGQLNWPVPLMAGAGVLLLLIGWILVFGKRERHEP